MKTLVLILCVAVLLFVPMGHVAAWTPYHFPMCLHTVVDGQNVVIDCPYQLAVDKSLAVPM